MTQFQTFGDADQYSAAVRLDGPWDMATVESYLRGAVIPARVATLGQTGPLVQSMWFLWEDGQLWLATQRSAVIAQRLAGDDRCAFEVAGDGMPYHGVRGQGRALVDASRGEQVLRRLIERYLGSSEHGLARWLLSRAEHEVAIGIRPDHLVSWDYRRRME